MTVELPDRLAGAVWGHLVGDAAGVPYEFGPPMAAEAVVFGLEGGSHRQPPGTWSDDGALMLALLDSLLTTGFDPEDQGRRIRAWQEDGAYTPDGDGAFDIGGTTRAAVTRLRAGVAALEAGPSDVNANGNGSLMRILPLPLVMREVDDATAIRMARDASRVTHGHPVAQLTCALYVLVARQLLAGAGAATALAQATRALRVAVPGSRDADAEAGDGAALDLLLGWTGRSGRGYVVDSFWSAWDAFAGAADYEDAIRRAISYGRDTDTTAAIAGGLAGIRFGWKGIPVAWRTAMRDPAQIAGLVDRLLETDGVVTSRARPYRVDFVELARTPVGRSWPGRLGMTILPGQKRRALHSYRWRELGADVRRLHDEIGADSLVVLNEDHELLLVGVPELESAVPAASLELIRHPVADLDLPADRAAYQALVIDLVRRLADGRTVAVACMGGLGRTGTLVGCILREAGLDGEAALALAREARPGVAESADQEAYVRAWTPVAGRGPIEP